MLDRTVAIRREINMVKIKNAEELLKNAKSSLDRKARELVINALNTALEAVDPKAIIQSQIKLKGNTLKIGKLSFNLQSFGNIFVVGGGKASGSMAEALEELLGDYIRGGIINVPYASPSYKTKRIKLQYASHPIPDISGVEGAGRMLDLVSHVKENDLIICLLSGGGSSLMPQPRNGISLEDKRMVTDALLKSGAMINEINTVRKHISSFKGGWLAKKAYPATVVNLILSDVVDDPLDSIASGPTVPDSTTFHDAIEILKRYNLWIMIPKSVTKVLLDGEKGLIPETPKADDRVFTKVHNIVVGNNMTASLAAYKNIQKTGINALFLSSRLEGQAKDVGTLFASIAKEVIASGNPVPKPASIIAGGETTVTVVGKGKGGRNQEIALGAALKIGGIDGVVVASISTDGVDGPTDAAGAIADGKTLLRSHELGLDPRKFLAENNSYSLFSKLGNLIFTGPTGTNVCDVAVVVVL
jgi:glycerate 2-kinase